MLVNFFPSGIWHSKINFLKKQETLDKILILHKEKGILKPQDWPCDIFSTFENEEEKYIKSINSHIIPDEFFILIDNEVEKYVNQLNLSEYGVFKTQHAWINVYKKEQFQEIHVHTTSDNVLECDKPFFSGIYYIKLRDFHLATMFVNPVFYKQRIPNDINQNENNLIYHTPKVEEGDIIIFPSALPHGVPMNQHDELRVTISFNIFLKEYDTQKDKKIYQ